MKDGNLHGCAMCSDKDDYNLQFSLNLPRAMGWELS